MSHTLTVRLPEPLNRDLSDLAKRMQLKRSDVVRIAVQKLIQDFENQTQDNPYDRVKHLVGVVSSGVPDLGSRHREHILKKIRRE